MKRTLAALLLVFSSDFAHAQVQKSDADRMLELERRVMTLERRLGAAPTAREPTAALHKDRANWRQLRLGMTQESVRQLLGDPERVTGGSVTMWQWSAGYTMFAGNTQLLTGWSEP